MFFRIHIGDLKTIAEMKGQGAEYISCSFDTNDEDYVEGCVTLFFWRPATEVDTIVIVENTMFYKSLLNICDNHIASYPEDAADIQKYLKIIKKDLNI